MVASTLLVQADLSGTVFGGTFVPTDVSRFLRLVDGVAMTAWRQDALSDPAPATLSLTFDNDALPGDATAPNAGRFTPGLTSSPWSGKLVPGVRVRVTETVGGTPFHLYDGYVLDWTTQPADDGTFPTTQINCVDALGWMATLEALRSIAIEELLVDNPASVYPLDEANGSTTAGDVGGAHRAPATVRAAKRGASTSTFAFGTAVPFVGVAGGLKLTSPDAGSGSSNSRCYYLSVPNALPASGTGWTISVAFVGPTSVPSAFDETLWSVPSPDDVNGTALLQIDPAGGVPNLVITNGLAISIFGASTVCDGKPHVIECSLSADGKTVTMVLDGIVTSGTAAASVGPTTTSLPISVGARVFSGGNAGYPCAATFNLFAQYAAALSTARGGAHYNAAVTAFAGERTDTHVARLLTYRPGSGSVLDVGKGVVGPHNTEGQTLTDALLATAKAEGGLVYADGQGRVVFLNRARLYDPASAATLDAEADLDGRSYKTRIDAQQLTNDMTVSQPNGASQRVVDAASIATFGPRQRSETYIVNGDRDAADVAGWTVANGKTPTVRTPGLDADVVTMTSTAQAQALLARGPFDRVALSNLPTWAPPTDVMVQGRAIRISESEFVVSFFTSSLPRKTLRADAAASANTKLDNGLVIPW